MKVVRDASSLFLFCLPNPIDVGILPTIMNSTFAHNHHVHHRMPPKGREILCAYLN